MPDVCGAKTQTPSFKPARQASYQLSVILGRGRSTPTKPVILLPSPAPQTAASHNIPHPGWPQTPYGAEVTADPPASVVLDGRRVHHAQFIWLELSHVPALQDSWVSHTLGVINLRQLIIPLSSRHPKMWPLTSGTVAEGGRLHPTQLASHGESI